MDDPVIRLEAKRYARYANKPSSASTRIKLLSNLVLVLGTLPRTHPSLLCDLDAQFQNPVNESVMRAPLHHTAPKHPSRDGS